MGRARALLWPKLLSPVGREKVLLMLDCGDEVSAGAGGCGGVGGMSSGGGDGMIVGGPSIDPKKFMDVPKFVVTLHFIHA